MEGLVPVLFVAYFLGKLAVKKGLPRNMYWILVPVIWFGAQFFAVLIGDALRQSEFEIDYSFIVFLLSILIPIVSYILMYIKLKKLPNRGAFERKIDELGRDQ